MINKFAHFYIKNERNEQRDHIILRMSLYQSGPATSSQISMNVTCLCDNFSNIGLNGLSMNACYAVHKIN